MILQALVKEYEKLVEKKLVPEIGWCQANVSYAIDLKEDGTIKEIHSLKTDEMIGKKQMWKPSKRCEANSRSVSFRSVRLWLLPDSVCRPVF